MILHDYIHMNYPEEETMKEMRLAISLISGERVDGMSNHWERVHKVSF